ncbi:Snf7-domain-containing protein [Polychytrium aggregatum]|uniref:Snf7-domain-containing protein n=1 Tax=Polychytrium aggregatum TaxID=110093 RepID=UPI0022FDE371|nr:Snf7-domain-containing protein [Polychytrium aggregatum]KAI9208186.1 Snf7-domain-containing protein [Polychytrium aggregatum]
MNLFGKAKAKPNAKDAIVKLRETLEMLDKRESYLQTRIDNELKLARANASKNKKVALMALKKKKVYEGQMEKLSQTKFTIEQQVMTIENANVNLETIKALKTGGDTLKAIHGELNVDKVDNVMDDIREQMDVANEISEAISQPTFGQELDEDELNAELELLEQQELDNTLLDTSRITSALPSLPNVPTTNPAVANPPRPVRAQPVLDDDEAELAELKASMAL